MTDDEVKAVARAIMPEAWISASEGGFTDPVERAEFQRQSLIDARAAIAALDAVRGWRPIETAQKDGAHIHLLANNGDQYIASWQEGMRDQWPNCWVETDGGRALNDEWFVGWMPLPPVPEDKP